VNKMFNDILKCVKFEMNLLSVIPDEVVVEISNKLDVISAVNLKITCKRMNNIVVTFQRKQVRFCDVPLPFRYEIKNYEMFCKYARMVDFSRTEIDAKSICDIVINVPHLTYVRARDCHNLIAEHLFEILESVYDDERISNRHMYFDLTKDNYKSHFDNYNRIFDGKIKSNIIQIPGTKACPICSDYCHTFIQNSCNKCKYRSHKSFETCINCINHFTCDICKIYWCWMIERRKEVINCCVCGVNKCTDCESNTECNRCVVGNVCHSCRQELEEMGRDGLDKCTICGENAKCRRRRGVYACLLCEEIGYVMDF
jgi:hypothetical protein